MNDFYLWIVAYLFCSTIALGIIPESFSGTEILFYLIFSPVVVPFNIALAIGNIIGKLVRW